MYTVADRRVAKRVQLLVEIGVRRHRHDARLGGPAPAPTPVTRPLVVTRRRTVGGL